MRKEKMKSFWWIAAKQIQTDPNVMLFPSNIRQKFSEVVFNRNKQPNDYWYELVHVHFLKDFGNVHLWMCSRKIQYIIKFMPKMGNPNINEK